MDNDALKVEWTPTDKLFCNPANPRINDPAIPHVAASIRRFGWQQPIVAKPSGEVIAGNTRLKAAITLGMSQVPVIRFSGTELDATAYGIADNKTHDYSEWDEPALAKILKDLESEDALDGVGYNEEDIDKLLADLQAETDAQLEVEEDDIPEPPEEAVTRLGDLWILGNHRLLCGDSSKAEDVDRLLGGAKVHLVNTDPPYNVRVEPRSNNAIAAGNSSFKQTHHQKLDLKRFPGKSKPTTKKLRAKDRPLANDFMKDEDYDKILQAWFGNISRVLLTGRCFYIWGGYANCGNYPPVLKEMGLYFSQAIIWVKEHPVLTRKDFMGNHEWCFYGWREGAGHKFFGPNNAVDVWSVKKINPQSMVHLTEKPVELAARAIRYSSQLNENVLDLFGGSGSTLIACEQLNRKAFLMELDPLYTDVIVTRWEKFSGKKAILEGGGTYTEVAEKRLPVEKR